MKLPTYAAYVAYAAYTALLLLLSGATQAASEAEKLNEIAEQYFQQHVTLDPLEGSSTLGEARFEDKLEITISPEYLKKNRALIVNTLQQLKKVDQTKLAPADKITWQVLQYQMQDQLALDEFPSHLIPVDQLGGLPVYLAQLGSGQDIQPLTTPQQYQHYLTRLERLPAWMDQAIANMREGIKRGVVQPKALISRGLPAIKALAEPDIEKNPFYIAAKNIPDSFSAEDKSNIRESYQTAIRSRLIPAAQKFADFMEKEYLPKARDTAGIGALPKGVDWYNALVKDFTTTEMTPEQIHNLGLAEVARIRGEMEKIKTRYDFKGNLTEFLAWQDKDPQFKPFKTEQDILNAYEALNKKVVAKLPQLFGVMPKTPLIIRPEPELTKSTMSDHYNPPAIDGSRPGTFYTVIENPADYRSTRMTSLFLHEGQPGHHFHIAMQQQMPLPKFRKYGWITAYGEGWALYAETLGNEMGLYEDPIQYLGHLKLELTRAVRLVTDTGLHAKGWTREQTINYMMTTEGIAENDARRATERYMAWPGQALAYKIGALKIQELRKRAQEKLRSKFSLSKYHDLVLSDGALPLSVLETKVDNWIADELKK